MSTNHDAVAAIPSAGSADKVLMRNVLTKRMAYVLADADNVTNLVAVDPATAAAIIDILFLGRVFHYDPNDVTTAHDGVSCLVSFDSRRYKLSSSADVIAFAVLDNTHAAPPVSPAIGDCYLIAAAATGSWVGKSNFVTVFTRRGWEFINFGIGRMLYVQAIDSYLHKNAGGSWVTGLGAQTLAANAVPLSAAINFGKRLIVENQTTTVPPGSPTIGTAYIIGPAATGAWAGQDGRIAICEVAGSFVIYTPSNGWEAYDKNLSVAYVYSGAAWISAPGAWVKQRSAATQGSGGNSVGSSGTYSYSSSIAPTTTQLAIEDTANIITHTAKSGSASLFLHWSAALAGNTVPGQYVVALFKDAGSIAIDWDPVALASNNTRVAVKFGVQAGDTASHTYKIRVMFTGAAAPSSFTHSRFELEEASI